MKIVYFGEVTISHCMVSWYHPSAHHKPNAFKNLKQHYHVIKKTYFSNHWVLVQIPGGQLFNDISKATGNKKRRYLQFMFNDAVKLY